MAHPRITPQQEARILALRKTGKTYREICAITGHGIHTVGAVVRGRPQKRKRKQPQTCEDCGTMTSWQYFREGGRLRCIECAGRARLEANGRTI